MSNEQTFLQALTERGVSRRSFLKFAALTASSLALTSQQARFFREALAEVPASKAKAIWLSFQQCTGCSESILRSFNPTIESLILGPISLDYHETLQSAAGDQAEKMRRDTMDAGGYVLIMDGSIPTGDAEFWSCAAGNSNLRSLNEAVQGAALIIALGTCATYGGIPAANPNPSQAYGLGDLIDKGLVKMDIPGAPLPPYVNISGCPPLAEVITGTIAYYLTMGMPELDSLKRPTVFYGATVHDTCPRHAHWEANEFALSHGDENARKGWCLLHLGCRGPEVRNACTRLGWNTDPADDPNLILKNSPMHTGHGCIGCSEPKFWDTGLNNRFSQGFYTIQQ